MYRIVIRGPITLMEIGNKDAQVECQASLIHSSQGKATVHVND